MQPPERTVKGSTCEPRRMQRVVYIRVRLDIFYTHITQASSTKRRLYVRSPSNISIIVNSTGKHVVVVNSRVCVCTTAEKSEARVLYIVE